jgi:hypothetical protein
MAETNLKRRISRILRELSGEISDGLNYGIPHLVGEIRAGQDGPEIEISVVVFDGKSHAMRLIVGNELLFLYPAEDPHPYRLFLDFWRFLEGKGSEKKKLEKGNRVRGPIDETLRKHGYNVLWMNVQTTGNGEITQVWARRGGVRYNMTFKKVGKNEFLLVDVTTV